MKYLARPLFTILATVGALLLLWSFRQAWLLLLISVTLATLVAPAIERLSRRAPRFVAVGIVYGASILSIGLILTLIARPLVQDLQHMVEDAARMHRHVDENWREGNVLQEYIVQRLPPVEEPWNPTRSIGAAALVGGVLGLGGNLFVLAIKVFLVIVVSIYWSVDAHHIERLWLLLLPLDFRISARKLWRRIQAEVGNYMRSELLQAAIAACAIGCAFSWVGFPYPIAMAVLAGIAWLVPWLGPLLAVTAVWGASTLNFIDVTPTAGLARVLVCSGFVLLVFVVLEFYVQPKLLDRHRYSLLFVVVTTLVLIQFIGIVALLLGPPVTIALHIVFSRLFLRSIPDHSHCPSADCPSADLPAVQQRLAEIRTALGQKDTPRARRLNSLAEQIEELLHDAAEEFDWESAPVD